MDALSFLRADHQSVLGMFEVLDGASTGTGATESGLETMVANLLIAKSQHEAIEEQLFWPAVRTPRSDRIRCGRVGQALWAHFARSSACIEARHARRVPQVTERNGSRAGP